MGEADTAVRGSACAATFIATGSSSVLPALIVEVVAADSPDAREIISRLAETGLARMASASEMPGRAPGWMLFARRGLDWVDVLMRETDLRAFFRGTCIMKEDWLESAARTGYCVLLAGNIDLSGVPGAASDPEVVTRTVDAAAAAGLVAGGMVPVYLPGYEPPRTGRAWPGNVAYRRQRPGGTPRRPPGWSLDLAAMEDFDEVANTVRAKARGMSYEWVRQQVAVELLLRGQLIPPRIVDQVAESIAFMGPAGRARRAARAGRAAIATNWLVARSVAAFALRRPFPHWHILGMHVIRTSRWGSCLDVAVDPCAGELLAMGESDEIDVWLSLPEKGAQVTGPNGIVVYRGDYRLGVLSDDTDAYRTILLESRHADTHILTDAIRSLLADGSWGLRIRVPEARLS